MSDRPINEATEALAYEDSNEEYPLGEYDLKEQPPFGLDHPLLSADEEAMLGRLAWDGDVAARDMLASSNLKLVWQLAGQIKMRERIEMFGSGQVALLRAIENWDPDHPKARRLSGYAWSAIWRSMLDEASRGHFAPIEVPNGLNEEPTTIYPEMYGFEDYIEVSKKSPPVKVETLLSASESTFDELEEIEEQRREALRLLDMIFAAGGLNEREIESLRRVHGIDYPSALSYAELGEAMRVTKKGAWGIYQRALRKARAGAAELGGETQ